MDHNQFKLEEDLILPFKKFLKQLEESNKPMKKGDPGISSNSQRERVVDPRAVYMVTTDKKSEIRCNLYD